MKHAKVRPWQHERYAPSATIVVTASAQAREHAADLLGADVDLEQLVVDSIHAGGLREVGPAGVAVLVALGRRDVVVLLRPSRSPDGEDAWMPIAVRRRRGGKRRP